MAKAAMVGSLWLLGFLVLALIMSPATAFLCAEAEALLSPCLTYLQGRSDNITEPCCLGAHVLNERVASKVDQMLLCNCFKIVAPAIGVQVDRVEQVSKRCSIGDGIRRIPNGPDCN
ncbi:hypothetical protein Acr_18g0005230 [Actinidia rufa]|uniref:Bifunctional inhibitor/plant lipid transfer protein/seed storage helical domain-containing protein n=1 Tax=Actinidia rufa TaxID=165716 RepID=A0A7J0G6D4_9ERIC|nr:hypothetical protein Acr_18g0005230 [Actinidia rufa]